MLAKNQSFNNKQPQPQLIKKQEVKTQFWQPRSSISKGNQVQKKTDVSILMVPCLNCEDLIALDEIDKHSRICCTVSKRVMAIGKSPSLFDEIDFKITKLKESLVQLVNNIKTKEIPQKGITDQIEKKIQYLGRACEIAEATLYVQNLGEIEERKLADVEQELKILSENYRGSLGVALYIERLHSLILQKYSVFQKQKNKTCQNRTHQNFYKSDDRSNSRNSKQSIGSSSTTQKEHLISMINEKKQEYDQMKQMTQIYQQKTQNQQKMMNNIMNININLQLTDSRNRDFHSPETIKNQQFTYDSNINGRPTMITKFSGSQERSQLLDQKSEILTQISSSQQWESEANGIDYQNGAFNSNGPSSNDQLQRIFYSKCLNQKMKMPSSHLSQKIPVSLLFKEVMQKRLQQNQWDQFIQKALQQPQDYIDMSKVQGSNNNNNRLVKNNLKEISQNQQFKYRLQQL